MRCVKPHLANVPGDYFVEDGCCTLCDVPRSTAPDLFEYIEDSEGYAHCYVKKQPETPDEWERMFLVITCAELSCIHYRGRDRATQARLIEAGEGEICVALPADLSGSMEPLVEVQHLPGERPRHERSGWLSALIRWWRPRG